MDGKRHQQEVDKKKRDRKSKVDKGHTQVLRRTSGYLCNSEKKRIRKEGEVEEIPKERNNSKNKRTKKQQEVTEEEEDEKKKKIKQEIDQENDQGKNMREEWRNPTDST